MFAIAYSKVIPAASLNHTGPPLVELISAGHDRVAAEAALSSTSQRASCARRVGAVLEELAEDCLPDEASA